MGDELVSPAPFSPFCPICRRFLRMFVLLGPLPFRRACNNLWGCQQYGNMFFARLRLDMLIACTMWKYQVSPGHRL